MNNSSSQQPTNYTTDEIIKMRRGGRDALFYMLHSLCTFIWIMQQTELSSCCCWFYLVLFWVLVGVPFQ